jgi:glycerol uptake facilitator-like aquaporin
MIAMKLWRKSLAEGIGTFALVFTGCGSLMVADRFPGSIPNAVIPVVFGLAVAAMVYAVGHISGAHFNPAVTPWPLPRQGIFREGRSWLIGWRK